jgi:hypothetical protein
VQAKKTNPELMLAEDMGGFFANPLGFVMYAFDWGNGELKGHNGPDEWQKEFLIDWGKAIEENNFDGVKPVSAYQDATSSGHGIGKSALVAWIILFIMSTRPFCKGVVTANTGEQLKTKTWGELGKWKKRCITGHWFSYNNGKGNMNIYHNDHTETWRCDATTSREENSESFAGLHAANSSPFYIFDEASAVPDKIWEVAEGGMTDGEPFWFVFGNPTRNTGRFRECFRKFRHRWKNRKIDSRKAKMTNKDKIQEWVDDYGEDSDFVKVRVRGEFPNMSIKQFIPEDTVQAARGKILRTEQFSFAPVILTCDPAWEGDDSLVIGKRQGLQFDILKVIPKNDNDVHVANLLANYEDQYNADAVFIDAGYGTGILSAGKTMGRLGWRLIWFSGESTDLGYFNKRAEMWGLMKKWLAEGGAIPDDDELVTDLTGPETVPRVDGKIQLESKKDMKARQLPSPNKADALALSFAFPVRKKTGGTHRTAQAVMD